MTNRIQSYYERRSGNSLFEADVASSDLSLAAAVKRCGLLTAELLAFETRAKATLRRLGWIGSEIDR